MQQQPPEELSLAEISQALQQLQDWAGELRVQSASKISTEKLPEDFDERFRSSLLERVERENPRLVPLVHAQFSTMLQEGLIIPRKAVGVPLSGNDIFKPTGRFFEEAEEGGATYMIMDKAGDGKMQSMRIVLVADESGKQELLYVFSDGARPVYPPGQTVADERLNRACTAPSRAANLLRHVEANGLTVLGWVCLFPHAQDLKANQREAVYVPFV